MNHTGRCTFLKTNYQCLTPAAEPLATSWFSIILSPIPIQSSTNCPQELALAQNDATLVHSPPPHLAMDIAITTHGIVGQEQPHMHHWPFNMHNSKLEICNTRCYAIHMFRAHDTYEFLSWPTDNGPLWLCYTYRRLWMSSRHYNRNWWF